MLAARTRSPRDSVRVPVPTVTIRSAAVVFVAVGLSQCSGGSSPASSGSVSGSTASGAVDDGGLIFAVPAPGPEAGADAAADTFGCNPMLTPKDAACILDDAYGVFVAPPAADGGAGGSDVSGNGTMALPYATIGTALKNLNGKSRVYLCGGTYPEQVTLDEAHAASLYGGLTCAAGASGLTWRYEGTVAQVRPSVADRPAITVSAGPTPIAIEDVGIESPATHVQDPTGAGQSSIAAWVDKSTVSFARVVLTAGDAANGADGTTLDNYERTVPPPGPQANGDPARQTCPPGAISPPGDGTLGGHGAVASPSGGDGVSFPPTTGAPPFDGKGGVFDMTSGNPSPGDDGASGFARSGGAAALVLGVLSDSSWAPSAGGDGRAGTPGQGGGAGGGLPNGVPDSGAFYPGGAGGVGGCGGGGGTGGKGGGASVALFSVSSMVTLTACQLTSAQAGNGGKGGSGDIGQPGGPPAFQAMGGHGGRGGAGAGGSGGAGGTGGLSAGVAYRGAEPIRDASTAIQVSHGAGAGQPGVGGQAGLGPSSGKVGAAGLAGAYFTSVAIPAAP